MDRDCEIHFDIGDKTVSIGVTSKDEEFVKGIYKTLLLLAREQASRSRSWLQAPMSLDAAAERLSIQTGHDLVSQATIARAWREEYAFTDRNQRCYRAVITSAMAATIPQRQHVTARNDFATSCRCGMKVLQLLNTERVAFLGSLQIESGFRWNVAVPFGCFI